MSAHRQDVVPIRAGNDPAAIAEAAACLRRGELVAFATETVYGLGADAGNDSAVARIFAAKGRPRFNPLIAHVTGLDAAAELALLDERAVALARRFWPGPLTLVLPRKQEAPLSLLVSAGLPTIAVRAPDHPVAQALLRAAGCALAAPSANPSSRLSPTLAAHVAGDFAGAALGPVMILDGGPCRLGVESTIIDLSEREMRLLRPGTISADAIEVETGCRFAVEPSSQIRAPGMLPRHYAPNRPLRLHVSSPLPGESWLGFGPEAEGATLNLSRSGDLVEAAANLFAMLHALDALPESGPIAISPIPQHGLGLAINDRLQRAATPPESSQDWNDERGPSAPCVLPDAMDQD